MKKLSDKIYYIGVSGDIGSLFEGLWPLPCGISYNSYIVADEKTALIDTVDGRFKDEFLSGIAEAVGVRNVDYLVVNHMEPDHSSLVSTVAEMYPSMKIVAAARAVPMLGGYYGIGADRIIVAGDGDSLSLGTSSLHFHMTPMVHWPETMMTWHDEDGTLFSGDAFGTFGSIEGAVADDEGTFRMYYDEMIRYYSNIVGKYGVPVQSALKKLSGLDIKRICSTHGPVWEKNISSVMSLYDRMSRYEAERGVCIVYGSMYGNTAAAAHSLAAELESAGIPHVLHDLSGDHGASLGISCALRDIFKYDTVAVGSPTYNNGIFPPVESFMKAMQSRLVRNRRFFAFGSYTWSAASVRLLNEMASAQGFDMISEGISFPQAYVPEKVDWSSILDILSN